MIHMIYIFYEDFNTCTWLKKWLHKFIKLTWIMLIQYRIIIIINIYIKWDNKIMILNILNIKTFSQLVDFKKHEIFILYKI